MKIAKKVATEFAKKVLGTSKGLELDHTCVWTIKLGLMKYDFWLKDDKIYMQHFVTNSCYYSTFYSLDTFEFDYEYTDKWRNESNEY